jgi:spore coat polysaccharide biosynthesis protein SpsF
VKKIGAIIQARTGSSRLPNKIFADIVEMPLLWHVYKRLTYSKLINQIIIATSDKREDDKIESFAIENNIYLYRGSENDVLSRFYYAAKIFNLDIIIRITADDPFKDPVMIDYALNRFIYFDLNFIYNNHPPTYPEGLDIEIFDFNSLEIAYNNADTLFEKEHMTQYFFKNLNHFRHLNILSKENNSNLRWTIDNSEDLQMTIHIYERLYVKGEIFLYEDILNLIKQEPYIAEINNNIKRSDMYKNL